MFFVNSSRHANVCKFDILVYQWIDNSQLNPEGADTFVTDDME